MIRHLVRRLRGQSLSSEHICIERGLSGIYWTSSTVGLNVFTHQRWDQEIGCGMNERFIQTT
jgi:hypothetical protein